MQRSDRVDLSAAVLAKAGATFLATPPDGGLPVDGRHPFGLFRDDARHLSGHAARATGGGHVAVRWRIPADGLAEARLRAEGTGAQAGLEVELRADFEPMLVLRGAAPALPPVALEALARPDGVELRGRGRDGVVRSTVVRADPAPDTVEGGVLRWRVAPGAEVRLMYALAPCRGSDPLHGGDGPALRSDDPALDAVVARAIDDLRVLRTPLDGHAYPAAGVPWYVALFGRDALICLLQAAPFLGDAAAGTLRLLAARIGARDDPRREEEPGKIPHEIRHGELAAVDATPLARYFGAVDATPLFLCALGEHAAWSGSPALWEELRGAVDAALGWLAAGPATYRASAAGGLRHQAWKDSDDGLPGADGAQPADPVAVVEAHGYAVAAKRAMAALAERHGDGARAGAVRREAGALAAGLESFWLDARRGYAMARGGDGRALGSVGSNQGHLLWARAVAPGRAAAVRDVLLSPAMWTGWGVRTLAAGERAYDPRSYHRGSVWPHDTALFAAGLRAYGFDAAFERVCGGLLDAAAALPDHRLPELFAGTPREDGAPPQTYASACRPQAWAAGSALLLVRTALGLEPDALAGRLVVRRPLLPGRAREIELTGLPVGGGRVDLRLARTAGGRVEVRATAEGGAPRVDVVDAS